MPCSHYFDRSKGVVFVTSSGRVTDADWISNLTAMARSPDFHPDLRGFSDYTGVTESLVTAKTMELFADNPAASPESRWAFLIKPGLAGAKIEFYKSNLKHGQLQIFTDRAKALAWLNEGVAPDKVITWRQQVEGVTEV